MLAEYSLEKRTALVTGGSRGIGRGIVEVLWEAGATVVVNALTDRFLTPLVADLNGRRAGSALAVAGDVTGWDGAEKVITRGMELAGPIDILVNNLGDSRPADFVPSPGSSAGFETEESIRRTLDLNLMGTLFCTRAIGQSMIARGKGRVINIGASAELMRGAASMMNLTVTSTAKTALTGFTRTLAYEWARHGITVNMIAPGSFPDVTDIGEHVLRQRETMAREKTPLGRVGELREVGLLALYLASDASSYMTGQVLNLDGGGSM